ncbi:hypothetical protein [Bacillus pumilus]
MLIECLFEEWMGAFQT